MANKQRFGGSLLAALFIFSACSSGEPTTLAELNGEAEQPCPDGQVWAEAAEQCLNAPEPAPTTSTTVAEQTTSDTETEDDTETETEVAVAPTTSIVASDQIPDQLTWATEGTPEADIERVFWVANTSRREAIEANNPDLEAFVESHTGRELARQLEAFDLDDAEGVTYRYPEPSETLIEFITLVTPTEALMQVCEQDRAEYFINGELTDDADYDSQFQARFVLGDDSEWRWEERIKLTFEALEEGEVSACMDAS